MSSENARSIPPTRRDLIRGLGAGALAVGLGRHVDAAETETSPSTGEAIRSASAPVGPPGNNIYFEKELKRMRFDLYHHPPINILKGGFRPVGGRPADFAVIHHDGREHFFYIERRLVEGLLRHDRFLDHGFGPVHGQHRHLQLRRQHGRPGVHLPVHARSDRYRGHHAGRQSGQSPDLCARLQQRCV